MSSAMNIQSIQTAIRIATGVCDEHTEHNLTAVDLDAIQTLIEVAQDVVAREKQIANATALAQAQVGQPRRKNALSVAELESKVTELEDENSDLRAKVAEQDRALVGEPRRVVGRCKGLVG